VCLVDSCCRRLYSSAAAAGIEVPYEANLNNVGALVWLEQLMVRGGGHVYLGGGDWCVGGIGREGFMGIMGVMGVMD
jgi:hypothetical protein